MTSFIWILFVVLCAQLPCADSANKLLRLVCPPEIRWVHGTDCLFKCTVKSQAEKVHIISASCTRSEEHPSLGVMDEGNSKPEDPRFNFLPSQRTGSNISFLMKNTQRTDAGKYKCLIVADSGEDSTDVSLIVTANYSMPAMSSVPEKDIQEEMDITMFCNASGGYPLGKIHWYDQYNNSWTRSAETTAVETPDKRINLISKFTLKASSSSPLYRCVVLNSEDEKQGEAELELSFPAKDPEKILGGKNSTALTAIGVIAGSLLCGLLVLALVRRRKARQARRPSTRPILSEMRAPYDDSAMVEEGLPVLNTEPESATPTQSV